MGVGGFVWAGLAGEGITDKFFFNAKLVRFPLISRGWPASALIYKVIFKNANTFWSEMSTFISNILIISFLHVAQQKRALSQQELSRSCSNQSFIMCLKSYNRKVIQCTVVDPQLWFPFTLRLCKLHQWQNPCCLPYSCFSWSVFSSSGLNNHAKNKVSCRTWCRLYMYAQTLIKWVGFETWHGGNHMERFAVTPLMTNSDELVWFWEEPLV